VETVAASVSSRPVTLKKRKTKRSKETRHGLEKYIGKVKKGMAKLHVMEASRIKTHTHTQTERESVLSSI
jgi:hypothetical protein